MRYEQEKAWQEAATIPRRWNEQPKLEKQRAADATSRNATFR